MNIVDESSCKMLTQQASAIRNVMHLLTKLEGRTGKYLAPSA